MADKKKEVTDSDLEALVRNEIQVIADKYELDYLHVSTGNSTIPTTTIRLKVDGTPIQEASCGHGPIDAIYKAIDRITNISVKLDEYNIKAVTSGEDALGEVIVKVRENGHAYVGRGLSTDIIEASTLAYLNAINKMIRAIK